MAENRIAADQATQEAEDRKILSKLMENQGWSKCLVLWDKLLMRNEADKAAILRQGKSDSPYQPYYLQGKVDGIKEAIKEIKRKAARLEEGGGPNY